MRRKYGMGNRLNTDVNGEDVNPMDGVSNLADIMLVFACGLMMALIINWNIDVAGTAESAVSVEQGQEVAQSSGDSETGNMGESAKYEEYGVVYRDPETGKLYMVTGGE